MITDREPCHHSHVDKDCREDHADRFELDHLPPWSPEPNPIERAGKLTRRQANHNLYLVSLDAVPAAVETVFDGWRCSNEPLRRPCAIT